MKFPFRTALVTILVVLVTSTALIIGISSYENGQAIVANLLDQVIEQTNSRIDQQISGLFQDAAEHTNLIAQLIKSGEIDRQSDEQLVRFFLPAMAAHRSLMSCFAVREADGTGIGIWRDGQTFHIWQVVRDPETKQFHMRDYLAQDFPKKPTAIERDIPDPRTRPWYRAARQSKQAVWTETYHFLPAFVEQATLGLTFAMPLFNSEGKLLAVVESDLDVGQVSDFLKHLKIGQNGIAFIVEFRRDGKRRVIAVPDRRKVQDMFDSLRGDAGNPHASLQNLGDSRIDGFMNQLPGELVNEKGQFLFVVDGVRYVGSYDRLDDPAAPEWLIGVVIPEEDIMGQVDAGIRRHVLFAWVILLIAIGISLYVSAQVARPLEYLSRETEAIAQLQIEPRPVMHSVIREVDQLSLAIEEMKTGLRSFQKYVPAELVRSIVRSGQEANLGGEAREVTIFFADIQGFTTIAETMSPEELVSQLREYLTALSGIIAATQGTVDKYIGDAIMAFWGAPSLDAQHALHACVAAWRGQQKLAELRSAWESSGKPPFHTRMGLNTGNVVVGNIGSESRLNYTVMGDAVNLANRIEGLNKFYGTKILITETTFAAAGETIVARPLDRVSVKGKTQGVFVYELLGLRSEVSRDVIDLAERFATGVQHYQNRAWDDALTVFHAVLRERPDDVPSKLMVERCQSYKESPPGPDWTGIYHMETK
ncbi:MAG: adenylate/guanylate cyclase domain-containing protein [Gemmatales bacterium]|nr:MAG: adenylate/guanylate cyclase domain-containing protein [Gemmatales bacterium]